MNLVSLERIIYDFDNIHKVSTSSWRSIARNNWLPHALGLMGVRTAYDFKTTTIKAEGYRVILPCHKNLIVGAVYNRRRLPIMKGIPSKYKQELLAYPVDTSHKIDLYAGVGHTTFEEGDISFFYLDFPRDKNGVILIPDVEQLHEALTWHLTYMMIMSRRLKHPEIKLDSAMNMWEQKRDEAINYMSFPSPEDMIAWKDLRNNGLLYDIDEHYFER